MRLYGAIEKIEAQDDGTVRVYGVATSEAVDEQGEIVRAAAMRAAIPDYMRFPALREMHQLSAAGSTLVAEVAEDGTTRVVAHVVDPIAVAKVKSQVYRGFSIGGRITQRDIGNPKIITGLTLNEISLVDRPANPEAVFDCWKAAVAVGPSLDATERSRSVEEQPLSTSSGPAQRPFNSPVQIWDCGVPEHRHLAKTDAAKCLQDEKNPPAKIKTLTASAVPETAPAEKTIAATDEENSTDRDAHNGDIAYADPGYQADGKRRYPVDTELHIRAAWNFINKPGNAAKYTVDQLRRIREAIIAAWKSTIDRDGPPSAGDRHKAAHAAGLVTRANHSRADQALLDAAYLACNKCLAMGGLLLQQRENMGRARDHLHKAGAMATPTAATDAEDNDGALAGHLDGGIRCEVAKILDIIATSLRKRGRAQQHMMDMAHECLRELSDGTTCGQPEKIGTRHSRETMLDLQAAHGHLVAAGAGCDGMPGGLGETEQPDTDIAIGEGTAPEGIAKLLASERAENLALAKVVGEIMPMLERLTKRVDEIARTPLPPMTMAKGTVSVSKQQDRGSSAQDGSAESSRDAIAAALAKMSKEDQTLTLIKASYANPIRVFGSSADDRALTAST